MRTRKAILPDAQHIHELISAYSGDGTLLPRTLAEICEKVRDFVVLEHEGRIIGCGALHLYGTHLAEIRSITVGPRAQGHGGGSRLVPDPHAGGFGLAGGRRERSFRPFDRLFGDWRALSRCDVRRRDGRDRRGLFLDGHHAALG